MAKVVAGDWNKDTHVAFITSDVLMFQTGIFRSEKINLDKIADFEVVTEDNRSSILGKVGWGAAGAIALGPLGLLAGVLGGGNKKDRVYTLYFKDGRKALIKGSSKDVEKIQAGTFAKQPRFGT